MGVIKDKGEFLNKNYINLLEMFNSVQTILDRNNNNKNNFSYY